MPTMPMRLPCRRPPSIEVGLQPDHLPLAHQPLALAHAARRGQHQRHRHVGGVLGQHARRVGDGDAALAGGVEIDMVDARAERGDQLQLRPGLRQHAAVDPVGHRGHQHVGRLHGLDELGAGHRLVVGVQARVEQLHQTRLDRVGQLSGDDHQRLLLGTGRHVNWDRRWLETGLSPITNSARVLSSERRPSMMHAGKSRLFRYLSLDVNNSGIQAPMGIRSSVLLCAFSVALAAFSPASGRRQGSSRRRQADQPPAQGLGPAHSALRVAPLGRGQCPHRAGLALSHRLDVQAQGHAGRDRRRVRELAQNPRLAGRQRLGPPEPAQRQAQLHHLRQKPPASTRRRPRRPMSWPSSSRRSPAKSAPAPATGAGSRLPA